jgi:2',3'-cyclic-nucleotide 2'-phosphodiesterase (5'-nucleotidase family)
LDETMNEVLAHSEMSFEKGQPESRLGNLVADLCFDAGLKYTQFPDDRTNSFCVLNNGGLRSSLPAGTITRRNVYELMPFDNELVVVTLSADSAYSLLKYIAEKGGVPIANLRLKINNGLPEAIEIGGHTYDKQKVYKVVTSDYLATGGDGMTMFAGALKMESTGIKVRDAIIDYLGANSKSQPFINSSTDGRISK